MGVTAWILVEKVALYEYSVKTWSPRTWKYNSG